jgi:ribosomal protein L11 methyltransferase
MKPREPQYKTRIELRLEKGVEELLPEDLYLLSRSGVWTEEKGGYVLVRFYPDDCAAFLDAVKATSVPVLEIREEKEELKDYSTLTHRYFRPIRIEDLTVRAPWNKGVPKEPSLIIEPGMAFGTGRHESTRLMIKIMKSIDFEGKSVLDLGCGSGILSLYARLLGARTVRAVDNDLDTTLNARKNVTLNKADNIEVICSDLALLGGLYDVVLANLDIRTFTAHVKKVTAFAAPGGLVVVSGILGRDRTKLLALFEPQTLLRMVEKNSWRGFLFQTENRRN